MVHLKKLHRLLLTQIALLHAPMHSHKQLLKRPSQHLTVPNLTYWRNWPIWGNSKMLIQKERTAHRPQLASPMLFLLKHLNYPRHE